MSENLQRFMELVSAEDHEYIDKLNQADLPAVIAMAAEKGIPLTEADFELAEDETEVSLEESDAVAGGKKCMCIAGGGGTGNGDDNTCACVAIGYGYGYRTWNKNQTYARKMWDERCVCYAMGAGETFN